MIVLTQDRNYKFEIREGSPSDDLVIRETWVENVYRITQGDFDNQRGERGVFLDLGANIGAVSVYAARMGAYVVAVEPDPDNLEYLTRNLTSNHGGPSLIVPAAAGPAPATLKLTPGHGHSRITEDGTVEVEAKTIEQILALASVDEVDVCKIDIEGYEYPLIEGTPSSVLRRIRYLTMEFDARPDDVFGRMVAKLAHDFAVTTLGSPERGGYIYARRYA